MFNICYRTLFFPLKGNFLFMEYYVYSTPDFLMIYFFNNRFENVVMTHSKSDFSAVTVWDIKDWLFMLRHRLTNPWWLRRVINHLWTNNPHLNIRKAASWQINICNCWEGDLRVTLRCHLPITEPNFISSA